MRRTHYRFARSRSYAEIGVTRWAFFALLPLGLMLGNASPHRWEQPDARNPLLPGYFADPSIVRDGKTTFIFATIDPWGGDQLGMWQSDNGRDWRFSKPNWPTKAAATSPESGRAKVWAPSVVKAHGRWWMYVSVGSEVWVGSAPSPSGPWADANGGKPLISRNYRPGYHMIDAEAFVDDDGRAYLAWGSGLNWVNGRCFVVALKPDMVTFDGEPQDVTPANYFEGPFLFKQAGRYYLTYSDGNTTKDTYKVRYAVGPTPLGPFTEAVNSPILQTDPSRDVISPGHHALFRSGGQTYILYHRQALPFPRAGDDVLRQVAIDPLTFAADGTIERVTPSHGSAVKGFADRRMTGLSYVARGNAADALHGPARAADDNYATLWRARANEDHPTLTADLGRARSVELSSIRPEYADRSYAIALEVSTDGKAWTSVRRETAMQGSPITISHPVTARYLRLTLPKSAGIWEWTIR
jgi:arabinoxylan arabinofuranohydrolase